MQARCCWGLLCLHTRLKHQQVRKQKEGPPRTPTSKQTTQPGNTSKDKNCRRNNTAQHHKTKRQTKQDGAQAGRRTTGGQEGAPSLPLTPGSTTKVLQPNNKKDIKTEQTTKQHVPTTHVSYQHKKAQTANKPKTKSKTSAGGGGTSRPTKGRKKIPTAPLLPTSHPPDPRRSREGRAISKRGGRRDPFPKPGDKRTRNKKREGETDRKGAPQHIANHPGPRSTMNLDPGVEMHGSGGPELVVKEEKKGIKTPGGGPANRP